MRFSLGALHKESGPHAPLLSLAGVAQSVEPGALCARTSGSLLLLAQSVMQREGFTQSIRTDKRTCKEKAVGVTGTDGFFRE